MRRIYILAGLLSLTVANAQHHGVGINNTTPKATLHIDVSTQNAQDGKTTNEGLLVPRLKKSRVGTMTDPENSTLVYVETIDNSTDPRVANISDPGFYYFDKPNNTWKALGNNGINQSQMLSATYVGATGSWMQNISANGNTITFKVTNTSSYTFAGLNFNQALILNNASQGLTYTPAEDYSSVSFTANQTKTFVYNISGTPASFGALTAAFNTAGLSAFGNIQVQEAAQTKSVEISFAGTYQAQKPLTNANTITLKVHNFTTQAVNGVDMRNAIQLSGINGVSVNPNQHTSVNFPAGQTVQLTYTLTGTPATSGTLLAQNNANLQVAGNVSTTQAVSEMSGVSATAIAFEGDYFVGQGMENTNVVKITLSNTNNYPVSNLNLSQALTLSGVGAAGVSVPANQNTSVSIPAGGTQVITYTLTGTPTQPGTITANWADSRIGTQTANRQVDQWEITPETITVANFTQNNTDFTITVNSTQPWNAELVNPGTNPWIKNIRKNNTNGNGTILFDTTPHDTTAPGGYRIRVYKTSDPSNGKYVYVFQQSQVSSNIPLAQTFFDIAGQTQDIETNYNGTITVIEKPDWVTSITQVGTKLRVVSAPRTDVGPRKNGKLVLEYGAGYRETYNDKLVQRQKANVCPETKPDWVPANVQYYKLANGSTLPGGTIQWTEYVGDYQTASVYSSYFATVNVTPLDGEYAVSYRRNKAYINVLGEIYNTYGELREYVAIIMYGKEPRYSFGGDNWTYDKDNSSKAASSGNGLGQRQQLLQSTKDLRVVICHEYKDNY